MSNMKKLIINILLISCLIVAVGVQNPAQAQSKARIENIDFYVFILNYRFKHKARVLSHAKIHPQPNVRQDILGKLGNDIIVLN